jgi:hypothetical protein
MKKTILEYKMVQKFMKKRFPNDTSSTNSTLENEDLISSEDNEQQTALVLEGTERLEQQVKKDI